MNLCRALIGFALSVVLFGTQPGCSFGGQCACPAASASVAVYAGPDGGVVPNAAAVFVGNPEVQSNCVIDQFNLETTCDWYVAGLDAGSYTVRITAPGFQTKDVPVTLSIKHGCGNCFEGTLSPNSVVLTPGEGDGGP